MFTIKFTMTMETGVIMAEKYRILRRTKDVDGKKKADCIFFKFDSLMIPEKLSKQKQYRTQKTAAAAVRFAGEEYTAGYITRKPGHVHTKILSRFLG